VADAARAIYFSVEFFQAPKPSHDNPPEVPRMSTTTPRIAPVAIGLLAALSAGTLPAAPPVERFTSSSTYYLYYGTWDSTLLAQVQTNGYKVVIAEPRNLTRTQVADLQDGADGTPGNADDIRVLGYISFGEDNRPSIYQLDGNGQFVLVNGARVINTVSGGTGPRMDPRSNPSTQTIASTINSDGTASLGNASTGGTGYASFYVDGQDSDFNGTPNFDGKPDTSGEWGGAYVNAGDPAWFTTLKNMTAQNSGINGAANGNCGLDEILTTTVGKGLGCDGIFTDTIDTCAPNGWSWATKAEWTAPGYRQLMKTVREAYPTKFILQNRGTFFFRPDLEHYNVTTRPYIDGVFFESYCADSNDFDYVSPYFGENKWNVGKHMNAEADRADGFTVFGHNYFEPRATRQTITVDGNVSEWSTESQLQVNGPVDTGAINLIYAANDANYLYLRVSTDSGTNLNSANFNIYFDTDDSPSGGDVSTAGYVPTGSGSRIASELLYQWGGLYSQDTGVFNAGSVGSATVSANGGQTEWEIRIPRNLVHPSGHARYGSQNVFGADGSHILMLATWYNGTTTEYFPITESAYFEKNLGYRFEKAGPGSVYDSSFDETIKAHGWLDYHTDKWLLFAPNTRAQTYIDANADTAAPVWSTTANGGSTSANSARTGVQQLEAKDGAVTVRWDLADDQTRPVRYKIYYAPVSSGLSTSNLNASPWQNTGYVSGETPANYKWGSGGWGANNTTVFANEYTVAGLQNGQAYRFVVHAADSASTVHEDTNVATLDATPQKGSGSVYANIAVDGSFVDWPAEAQIWGDPSGDHATAGSDIKAIWMANDSVNLYMRVDTWNSHDMPNQYNNIYFDTDLNGSDTSFNPHGLNAIFSELLLQGGSLYSQKDGNFNDGSLGTVGIAPFGVSATSWEWAIPRNLQHPSGGGSVFGATGLKVLVTSGSSSTDEIAGAATYEFATASVFKTITANGTLASGEWPAHSLVYNDAQSDNSGAVTDIKAVYMANDSSNLYLRVDTWNSHDMPGAYNNFYFDTQVGSTPGFNPHGLGKISSKLLLNGVTLFSEGNGGYNDGTIGGTTYGPTAGTAATAWEFAIPLSSVHPTGSGARAGQDVFPDLGTEIQFLLTSDNSGPAEFAPDSGALKYKLAPITIVQGGTSTTINVTDGSISGWPTGAKMYDDPQGDNGSAPADLKAVWMANDSDYVYLRVDLWSAASLLDYHQHAWFDGDLSASTGFHPYSAAFGSDMMMEGTGLYSEKNGGFNDGNVTSSSSKTVAVYPTSGTATTFEWRIPRDLVHPSAGGNVFTQTDKSFLLWLTNENSGSVDGLTDTPDSVLLWYVPQ